MREKKDKFYQILPSQFTKWLKYINIIYLYFLETVPYAWIVNVPNFIARIHAIRLSVPFYLQNTELKTEDKSRFRICRIAVQLTIQSCHCKSASESSSLVSRTSKTTRQLQLSNRLHIQQAKQLPFTTKHSTPDTFLISIGLSHSLFPKKYPFRDFLFSFILHVIVFIYPFKYHNIIFQKLSLDIKLLTS